jgi:phosphate starvation-inducible PhoH-like protein
MTSKKNKVPQGAFFQEFKPQTNNQYEFLRSVAENDVIIGEGVAGVGKTFLSVGLACQYLIEGKIQRILVSRSIVGCDNELGYFPGDVSEKIAPYMLPYIDYFKYFIGTDRTEREIHYGNILLYPVELLRGHTYQR